MMLELTDTLRWRRQRATALSRDGHRCTVSRLLGGRCTGRLHVHHIVPRADGGGDELDNLGTSCAAHHPMWEALRRQLVERLLTAGHPDPEPRCRHQHRTTEARLLCERRMRLERGRELVA